MAGGVLGYLVDVYSPQNLHSIIVEPDKADCIYRSGVKGDIVNVGGDMATIMAGIACGEPNPLGWEILRNCATQFISCQDSVAALGMRISVMQRNDRASSPVNPALSVWAFSRRFIITRNVKA